MLGKVEYLTKNGKDVTKTYTDLQIRLDNALKACEHTCKLLEKTENASTALLTEKGSNGSIAP